MTDVSLRPFVPADAVEVSRVHFASENAALDEWNAGVRMPGAIEDASIGWLQPMPAGTTIHVAEIDRTIVGWVMVSIAPAGAELAGLYVHPSHWRVGIGSMLIRVADDRFIAADVERASLWCMERHDRGRAFYEAHGWTADPSRTQAVVIDGTQLPQIAYVKRYG